MKTLVTGVAGFIGSNVKLLIEQGHQVAVLDNLSIGYKSNLSHYQRVDFIKGDVRDLSGVCRVVEKAEVIFHLRVRGNVYIGEDGWHYGATGLLDWHWRGLLRSDANLRMIPATRSSLHSAEVTGCTTFAHGFCGNKHRFRSAA